MPKIDEELKARMEELGMEFVQNPPPEFSTTTVEFTEPFITHKLFDIPEVAVEQQRPIDAFYADDSMEYPMDPYWAAHFLYDPDIRYPLKELRITTDNVGVAHPKIIDELELDWPYWYIPLKVVILDCTLGGYLISKYPVQNLGAISSALSGEENSSKPSEGIPTLKKLLCAVKSAFGKGQK